MEEKRPETGSKLKSPHQLEYAAGKFPPRHKHPSRRLTRDIGTLFLFGTGANFAAALWGIQDLGRKIDGFVKAEGKMLWDSPRQDFYAQQAASTGNTLAIIMCVVTVLITFFALCRRAYWSVTILFVLANLFAMAVFVFGSDDAAMKHGLYP